MPQPRRKTAQSPEAQRELAHFSHRLHRSTPRIWVTHALVALNVGVWGLQILMGVDMNSPTAGVLFDWGGNLGTSVYEGEYWRLLTATALHGGMIHLAFNMFALWVIGQTVERVLGNTGFAATYLLSGLAGSVASVISSPDVVSVGASGAVFGILGAQLTGLLSRRVGLPAGLRGSIMRNGVFIIGINLWFGFTIPNIDNAAHMGGLLAGLIAGAVLAHPLTPEGVAGRGRRAIKVTLAGIALLATTFALLPAATAGASTQLHGALDDLEAIHAEVATIERQVTRGQLDAVEAAETVEQELIPKALRIIERVEKLELDPEHGRLVGAFMRAQTDVYRAFGDKLRAPSRASVRDFGEALDRARATAAAMNSPPQ